MKQKVPASGHIGTEVYPELPAMSPGYGAAMKPTQPGQGQAMVPVLWGKWSGQGRTGYPAQVISPLLLSSLVTGAGCSLVRGGWCSLGKGAAMGLAHGASENLVMGMKDPKNSQSNEGHL